MTYEVTTYFSDGGKMVTLTGYFEKAYKEFESRRPDPSVVRSYIMDYHTGELYATFDTLIDSCGLTQTTWFSADYLNGLLK